MSLMQFKIGDKVVSAPVKYPRLSALNILFPISTKKAEDLISLKRFKPVSIFGGNCLLDITIFDYIDCPVGPYREIALSIPVLFDSKLSIPFLPLLFGKYYKNFGFYTILLAMDTVPGVEHSKKIFGYPTFQNIINIDIKKNDSYIIIDSHEGDRKIFSMEVKLPENSTSLKGNFKTFFVNNGKIFSVEMETTSLVAESRNKNDAKLELGDHQIANLIKGLSIKSFPMDIFYYTEAMEILSPPSLLDDY